MDLSVRLKELSMNFLAVVVLSAGSPGRGGVFSYSEEHGLGFSEGGDRLTLPPLDCQRM